MEVLGIIAQNNVFPVLMGKGIDTVSTNDIEDVSTNNIIIVVPKQTLYWWDKAKR